MNNETIIVNALNKLVPFFGHDVLNINVTVVEDSAYPAYIDPNGVHIHQNTIDMCRRNVHVYIAHELLHPVVKDVRLLGKYNHSVLGWAEDFKINQIIYEHLGVDVRKLPIPGILNRRWFHRSLEQIAKACCKYDETNCPPNNLSVVHSPYVMQLADTMRKKLGFETESSVVSSILVDINEIEAHAARISNGSVWDINNVVVSEVIKALAVRIATTDEVVWNVRALGKSLSMTQALYTIPNVSSFVGLNTEQSVYAAHKLLSAFCEHKKILGNYVRKLAGHRSKITDKLSYFETHCRMRNIKGSRDKKKEFDRLVLRKAQLAKKIEHFSNLPLINELVTQSQVPIRVRNVKKDIAGTVARLSTSTVKYDVSHDLVKAIRFVESQVIDSILDTLDIAERFADMFSDLGSTCDDLDQEHDVDDEEIDADYVIQLSDATDNLGENPDKVLLDSDDSSQESGKNSGGKTETILETVGANPKIFKRILTSAEFFNESLIEKSTSKPEEGFFDRTIECGNRLESAVNSELGRLGNEHTRLSFLVDLANGNLVQYTDLSKKRGPIVLVLDCSGSMAGKAYEDASGFCLSLMLKMARLDRGIALVKFSSKTDDVFVPKTKPSIRELAQIFLNPSFGGTSFDNALTSAFSVINTFGWENAQVLLVSDGHDTISAEVVAKKPNSCKTTAVIIGGKQCLPGIDNVVHVKRSGLKLELVNIGNALL